MWNECEKEAIRELNSVSKNASNIKELNLQIAKIKNSIDIMLSIQNSSELYGIDVKESNAYKNAISRLNLLIGYSYREIVLYDEFRYKVIRRLSRMEKNHRDVLYKRYIEGKDFGRISDEMFYSYRSIMNLHRAGIDEYIRIKQEEPT